MRAYKRQTFAMLGVERGQRLLDVGCGAGDDAIELARMVGPSGAVVGIDVVVASTTAAVTDYAEAEQVFHFAAARHGLVDAGDVSAAAARLWAAALEEAARGRRFFSALTGFLVAGRRP